MWLKVIDLRGTAKWSVNWWFKAGAKSPFVELNGENL